MKPDELLTIRLEDIPASSISQFVTPKIDASYKEHVSSVLVQAHSAAKSAAEDFYKTASRDEKGLVHDACGFAHLVLHSSQSKLVTALLELDEATVIGGVGYWVSDFGGYGIPVQSILMAKAGVGGAMKVMKKAFPDEHFEMSSRLD